MDKSFFERSDSLKGQYTISDRLRNKSALQTYNPSKGNGKQSRQYLEKRNRFKSNPRQNSRTLLAATNSDLNTMVPRINSTKTTLVAPRSKSRPKNEDSFKPGKNFASFGSGKKAQTRKKSRTQKMPQLTVFQEDVVNAYGTQISGKRCRSVMRNYAPGHTISVV